MARPAELPDSPLAREAATLNRFRVQVFAATWLSYVGFYFCRHAFYVVKPALTQQLGLTASELGDIGMAYLVAYTAGQFASAWLGEKTGARLMLLVGMAISSATNVAFGFTSNYATFMAFMALNGLVQATGWSGNIGTMARWFRRRERGTVMGLWATCYQVGGFFAKSFAAFMLGLAGWRWSFFGASLVLAGVWLVFFFLQRNGPEDVGLPPVEDEAPDGGATVAPTPGEAAAPRRDWHGQMVATILVVGVAYFFIKYIRYALWSWSSYFLSLNFGLDGDEAGYFSTIFDLAGFAGVVAAGYVSDSVFRGRRTQLATILLIGMTGATIFLYAFGSTSLAMFGVGFGLIGFCLYGPDSLLSGAGAIDVSEGRHAIAAAGIINGMGSFGAIVQEKYLGVLLSDPSPESFEPPVVSMVSRLLRGAWHTNTAALDRVFLTLAISAAAAAVCIGVLWILAKRGKSQL